MDTIAVGVHGFAGIPRFALQPAMT